MLLVILSMAIGYYANGQKNFIQFLQHNKNAHIRITGIYPGNKLVPLPKELNCGISNHHYMAYAGELYLQIDGSGKLLKYDTVSSSFSRVDLTCYEGYNFGSYDFNWKGTFYSLGGWGFWQYNGGLRFFEEKLKEWMVYRIEQECPFSTLKNAVIWQDFNNNKIYVFYSPENSSYLQTIRTVYIDSLLMQCFDLNSMKWWPTPKLIIENYQELSGGINKKIIPTSRGIIIETNNGKKLFDINQNEIYDVGTKLFDNILGLTAKYHNAFSIQKDSTLFIYDTKTDTLVQVAITKDQFISTGKKFYQDIPKTEFIDWTKIILVLFLLIITSIGFIIYFKLKRKTEHLKNQFQILNEKYAASIEIKINNDGTFGSNLTVKELAAYNLLMAKTLNNESTSIDEINNILGVKNKDLTIQNQLRSDVFQNINKKFKVYATTNDTLIERERTEFDKRVYQYRINERYMNKLK